MDELNLLIAVIGAIILLLGLVSDYFRRNWWTSDPLAALGMGIILGPAVLGWINPTAWGLPQEQLLEQAARFTMAIGLMGVALRLPQQYFFRHWKSLAILLGFVMPIMWLTSGLLVYWMLDLPFWEAMLVGAAITPTDPIVSNSIVTGGVAEENLPKRIRHIISAESGANDGLAYPFVILCVLILEKTTSENQPLTAGNLFPYWLTQVVLWEVGGAVLFGIVGGYLAGRLLKWAERQKTIENSSFLTYSLALSLVVLGTAKLMGTDDILAVFIAGLAFGDVVGGPQRAEEDNVQEAINRFFTLPIFIMLGVMLPWQQWASIGWGNLGGLAILVLLFRRMPAILLLSRWIKPIHNRAETYFVGWFGPVGVAALFYAGFCLRRTEVEAVWLVCAFMICASIIVQGLSVTPLTKKYGQRHPQARSPQGSN
ncbi:MAG: cation:proton antiporter [Snowella sp.]|nr:cation:proton antiporter [Snowella sp.]